MSLPLCPCNSGSLYEKCCYLIKGEDGEPLFFKGAMSGDSQGNWHPLPNSRIDCVLVGRTNDRYREFAKSIADQSGLSTKSSLDFTDNFAIFLYSYEQLLNALKISQGKGIAFQMDSLEGRYHWKQFLFNGRVLLNFIGLHCTSAWGIKQKIDGLNRKKFKSLIKILEHEGRKETKFLTLKEAIIPYEEDILKFIDMRNREKTNYDTISQFPAIDSELGVKQDGELSLDGQNISMIEFIERSFKSILDFSKILLNVKNP